MYNSPWNLIEFCFQGVKVATPKIPSAINSISSHIHNILSKLLSEYKILWGYFTDPYSWPTVWQGWSLTRSMLYYTFFGDLLCTYN
jgi:hypothetical protein